MNLVPMHFHLKKINQIFSKKHKNIYNYSNYNGYRMPTTIQISKETKSLISSFGTKEDTYEDIIKRMYDLAVKEQLREFLLSSENTISLDDFRKEVEKKWPRSK